MGVRRFAEDAAPPVAPAETTLDAAVLWTDIVGFTPLTERMVAAGPEGVEQLSRSGAASSISLAPSG